MTNVIRLEIDTDDSYTEAEKETLLEAFLEFIQGEDPSVIEGTESISVKPSGSGNSDDERLTEKVNELIKTGTLSVQVWLVDKDGDEVFDTGNLPVALS